MDELGIYHRSMARYREGYAKLCELVPSPSQEIAQLMLQVLFPRYVLQFLS